MQHYTYPPYRQFYQPVPTQEDIKRQEKRRLRSSANATGFYVLTYIATMYLIVIVFSGILQMTDTYTNVTETYLDILASVGSAFIPGLIYMAATGFKPRNAFSKTSVHPTLLIPLVFIGIAVAMAANYATNIFAENISIFGIQNYGGTIEAESMSPFEIILMVVSVSVVPAFAEEFAFRGLVMGSLKKYGRAFAVVCSAIMFGAMHSNTSQIVFAFILGLVFGYIDIITDSILPSVIVHFLNNFYATVFTVLESNGGLSEETQMTLQLAVVLLFCLGGVLSFIYLVKTNKKIFELSAQEVSEYAPCDILTLKEKFTTYFVNPGVMISLTIFLILTIVNLIPPDALGV